jgi:hypothetical protein
MKSEDLHIKNIENGIRAIRMGTKEPKDANVGIHLNKLKPLNEGMYEELLQKYKNVVEDYNKRKEFLKQQRKIDNVDQQTVAYNKKHTFFGKLGSRSRDKLAKKSKRKLRVNINSGYMQSKSSDNIFTKSSDSSGTYNNFGDKSVFFKK